MILPTKHLPSDRSLIGIGGDVLALLDEPKTVSRLWDELRESRKRRRKHAVTFDRFVLALDFLFTIDGVHLCRERIVKGAPV